MAMCSLCARGEETAHLANEYLHQKLPLREIGTKFGIDFRVVDRHKHGKQPNCPHNFRDWLAAKSKAKNNAFDSRRQLVFTEWPDGTYSRQAIAHDYKGDLRATPGPEDVVVKIEFEPPVPPRIWKEPEEIPDAPETLPS